MVWSITLQYSIWSPYPQIRGLCHHLPGIVLQRVDQKLVQVYACRVRILLAAIWNKEQDAIELSGLMTGTQGRERVCNLSEFLPTQVKFKGSSWCENTCCLAGSRQNESEIWEDALDGGKTLVSEEGKGAHWWWWSVKYHVFSLCWKATGHCLHMTGTSNPQRPQELAIPWQPFLLKWSS